VLAEPDDLRLLDKGVVYDALYAWCQAHLKVIPG
jgi:hypothetical protein